MVHDFGTMGNYPRKQMLVNELRILLIRASHFWINANPDNAPSQLPTEAQVVAIDDPEAAYLGRFILR
jgi:hypothetical protein